MESSAVRRYSSCPRHRQQIPVRHSSHQAPPRASAGRSAGLGRAVQYGDIHHTIRVTFQLPHSVIKTVSCRPDILRHPTPAPTGPVTSPDWFPGDQPCPLPHNCVFTNKRAGAVGSVCSGGWPAGDYTEWWVVSAVSVGGWRSGGRHPSPQTAG